MSPLARWIRFNFVGMIGMAVQLSTLAFFNHFLPGHYLYATAAAIELTLLHNFLWHLHYTWRDRSGCASTSRQLARFHLSNGLVSLLGNLILMKFFLQVAHLPLLLSNFSAIILCSILNFFLGNYWAFAEFGWSSSVRKTVITKP